MSEKILKIYKSLLAYSSMVVEPNGTIYMQMPLLDSKTKVMIGDEPLVFPIDQQFDDPNQKKIYFHPLGESFVRGKSETVECLEQHIGIRINFVTAIVAGSLLELLGSAEKHRRLDVQQAELLKYVGDVDSNTHVRWSQLMPKITKASKGMGYVNVYLKHSGVWKGEAYGRVGVITFPFYQDLIDGKYDDNTQLREKDRVAFKKVFEFMFPGLAKAEAYNYGTRTRVAPWLDSLLMSSINVTSRLNDLIDTYSPYIEDYEELKFDTDWHESLQDLDSLKDEINRMPDLRGNKGVVNVNDRKHEPQALTSAPKQIIETRSAPVPVPEPIQRPQLTPSYQQPVPQQPAPYYGQQPQLQPQAPPVVRQNEEGKINFTDIVRANPGYAMINNPMVPKMVLPPHVQDYVQRFGMLPQGFDPNMPQQMTPFNQPMPGWGQVSPNQFQPQPQPFYPQQPVFNQPMPMQPQQQGLPPQLPMAHPGYQWVFDNQSNSWVQIPIQQQQQPFYPQTNNPPPGWYPR